MEDLNSNNLSQLMTKTFNLEEKLKRFHAGEDIEIASCTADEVMAILKEAFGSHILGWKEKTKGEVRKEQLLELKKLTMSAPNENKCKLFAY